jgi:hypothetical protein
MTGREQRLRERIDQVQELRSRAEYELRREQQVVKRLFGERERAIFGHCGYCGARTYGTVCGACRPAHDAYLEYLAGVA